MPKSKWKGMIRKTSKPWERLEAEGESPEAYAAFQLYLFNANPDSGKRSIDFAYRFGTHGEKGNIASGRWRLWQAKWLWVDRARAYDDHLHSQEKTELARLEKKQAHLWAQRRLSIREDAFSKASKIDAKVDEMLAFPTYEQTFTTDSEGRNITVVTPMKWTARDIGYLAKISSDLKRQAAEMSDTPKEVKITTDGPQASDAIPRHERLAALVQNLQQKQLGEGVPEDDVIEGEIIDAETIDEPRSF